MLSYNRNLMNFLWL